MRKQFDKLRSDKAAGADDISPKFLIELKEELCFPVTLIMRSSLESGTVPEDWKLANITPMFKVSRRELSPSFIDQPDLQII